jgi:hypothetical protein
MPIGWFDSLAAAESYFATERLETAAWDALLDGSTSGTKDEKTVVLNQAYNRLYYSKEFILPTYAEATVADLVILTKAQAEMAYYLAQHLADEDRRKGLQAQGVSAAGVVKESYKDTMLKETPIPAVVYDILCCYLSGIEVPFYAVNIDRDEDKDVHEDVTDL